MALCCLWADTELTRTPALIVVLLAQKGTTEGPPKSMLFYAYTATPQTSGNALLSAWSEFEVEYV